jgi:hypothetical protein
LAAPGALSLAEVSTSAPYTASSPAPEPYRRALIMGLPAAVALAYALGHLNWYLGTPLGMTPVLDERENLDLANAIFAHALPAEPFYRAPGYALVLAVLRMAGVPAAGLFPAALLLGVILHALGAVAVGTLTARWFGNTAAVVSGVLFAMNPVLVHFATQALDSTFSLTLFLAGLLYLDASVAVPGKMRFWATASLFWAAAAIVRPNYLLVWILVPLTALVPREGHPRRIPFVLASFAGVAVFAGAMAFQKAETGTAGFLPWQGAYNLWAANRPGANGRFYTQHISLPPALARANPARAESLILYEEETSGGPADIASMNAHWRRRFLSEVGTHPLDWAKLMYRKAYALVNNWEQYNNKTFAFHKALSPWLSWNPICWGFLFILSVVGFARLAGESPPAAAEALVVWAATAASILLFFASARFRLPLVALCTVLAGGVFEPPVLWWSRPLPRRLGLAACVVIAGSLAFSRLGGVDDPSTFVQDHALMARAAYTVGDDRTALSEARAALLLQPQHPDALAVEKAAMDELAVKGAKP